MLSMDGHGNPIYRLAMVVHASGEGVRRLAGLPGERRTAPGSRSLDEHGVEVGAREDRADGRAIQAV